MVIIHKHEILLTSFKFCGHFVILPLKIRKTTKHNIELTTRKVMLIAEFNLRFRHKLDFENSY